MLLMIFPLFISRDEIFLFKSRFTQTYVVLIYFAVKNCNLGQLSYKNAILLIKVLAELHRIFVAFDPQLDICLILSRIVQYYYNPFIVFVTLLILSYGY